jgi:hypothetical protein
LLPKKEVVPLEPVLTGTTAGAEADGLCLDEENKEKGLDLLTGVVWALEDGFVGDERLWGSRARASWNLA